MNPGDRVYLRRGGGLVNHRPHRGNWVGIVVVVAGEQIDVALGNRMFGTVRFNRDAWRAA